MITICRYEVAWMLARARLPDLAEWAIAGSLPARLSLRMIAKGTALGFPAIARVFAAEEVRRWDWIEAEERAVMV